MAKYRAFWTRTWKDPAFEKYTLKQRLVFIYLWTNESTTESGIYSISCKTIANETNISESQITEMLKTQFKNIEYDFEHQVVFVVNFLKYNGGGRPDLLEKSIGHDLDTIKTTLWQRFFKEYGNRFPTLYKRFTNGLKIVASNKSNDSNKSNPNSNTKELKEKDKNPFVELFNTTCPDLPKISSVSKSRLQKIAIRLKENPDLSWWKSVFEKANQVVIAGKAGQKDWKPSFDWLIENDKNALKVIEGNYDEHRLTWRDKYSDKGTGRGDS